MSQENVEILRPEASLAVPLLCHSRSESATAVAGSLSAGISQERGYALTRDPELLGDFLHSHSLAVQRECLFPPDPRPELIERLCRLGDQLDAEIPLRRFDYLPVGPPSRALTPDLSDPPLYLGHTPSVGIQDAF